MGRNYRLVVCAIAAFCVASQATAQVRPPSTTQPGQVQERLRIEDERPEVGGQSIITVPDQSGNYKKLDSSITFELKGIEFEGTTVFSQEQLRPLYAGYLHKKITLATLNEIANNITAKYRNEGYILSRAVVPPQKITDGIAKIRLIEGYINKVVFEGKHVDSYLISSYAQKIQDSKPLNAKTLERYLLLMEDLPGVSARAVIRPAANAPGASDVVITIDEKHVDGSATIDNRGTRFMGPVQAGLTVSANDAFGIYDRTQFHGAETAELNELHYGQIVHEEQLDSEGTKLALSGGYTMTHPDYILADAELEGRDALVSAQISHPFIRSRQDNLYGNIQFDVHDTTIESLGSQLYDDHLRIARAGGSYDFVDALSAVNKFDMEFSQGLNWGASEADSHSRAAGRTDFFKSNADASRLQPIYGPFDFYLGATGQFASDALLTAEQFALGGANYLSAYDPSEVLGDSGAAARAELRYNLAADLGIKLSYQFYGFYDLGKVWNRDALAGEESSQSLADTGIGLRFNADAPLSGSLEVAQPLTHGVAANGNDGEHTRVFFALAYRF